MNYEWKTNKNDGLTFSCRLSPVHFVAAGNLGWRISNRGLLPHQRTHGERVATVNRPSIDCGPCISTKTHGQFKNRIDRG